jgi:YVTN family beta-propeller protein
MGSLNKTLTFLLTLIFLTSLVTLRPPTVKAQDTVVATIKVGSFPSTLAITPNGEYAYVSNSASGTVSVINTTTNAVMATITLPYFYSTYSNSLVQSIPDGLAITPNGDYVYVTNEAGNGSSNTVYVISTATHKVTSVIDGLNYPKCVAISPNGEYAYITNTMFTLSNNEVVGINSISIINTATNRITANVGLEGRPSSVAVLPNGEFVYVTSASSGTASVISTATNTVTTTIGGLSNPLGVAAAPNGKYAYITNDLTDSAYGYTSGSISVIETATNKIVATVTGLSSPNKIAISPNGTYAYVTNISHGTVSVVDLAKNMVTANVTIGQTPTSITVTPNGKYAYVTNGNSGTISIISTDIAMPVSNPSPTVPEFNWIIILLLFMSCLFVTFAYRHRKIADLNQ